MRVFYLVFFFLGTQSVFSQIQLTPNVLPYSEFPLGKIDWVDLDSDGDLDAIAFEYDLDLLSLYENVNGTFNLIEDPFQLQSRTPVSYTLCDFDNDNDIDLLLVDLSGLFLASNQGGLSFELSSLNLDTNDYMYTSVAHFMDIDGDAKKDIIIDHSIYLNQAGEFRRSNLTLNNYLKNIHWADLNNDGQMDFIASHGYFSDTNPLYFFLNEGNGLFGEGELLAYSFRDNATMILSDVDHDDDMDIVFVNADNEVKMMGNQFSESGAVSFIDTYTIPDLSGTRLAVGDMNDDDLPDLIVSHGPVEDYSTYAYLNQSTSSAVAFTKVDLNIHHYYVYHTGLTDLDKDGDLDLIISNTAHAPSYNNEVMIYRNDQTPLPARPLAPTNLNATVNNPDATLTWSAAENNAGYNLELKQNGKLITTPMTLADGTLLWPGNPLVTSNESTQLINLPEGDYEWRVQSINHAQQASVFSSPQLFRIETPPVNLTFEVIDISEIILKWEYFGSGATSFSIFRKSANGSFIALASVPGNEKTFIDKNIPANEKFEYYIKAVYGTVYSRPSNIARYFSGPFNEERFDLTIANIIESVAVSADYDKDEDYDVGIIGRIDYQFGNAAILKNDGTGTYSRSAFIPTFYEPFAQIIRSKDMDNDGDTDVCVVFGSDYSWRKVMVYHNQNGIFAKVFETEQQLGIYQLEVEDINHDGRQDIVYIQTLGNSTGNPALLKILFQELSGQFVDSNIQITDPELESYSRFKVTDLNNDGYLDLFLFGSSNYGAPKLFLNQNGNAFREVSTSTLPLLGEPLFYDFNGDGITDIIQSGYISLQFYSGLGDLKFSEPAEVSLGNMGYNQPAQMLVADFDLNGMPDLLVNDGYNAKIVKGTPEGGFILDDFEFSSNWYSQIQLTNMDHDSDIDILKLGTDDQHTGIHYFYRNQMATVNKSNSTPGAPSAVGVFHTNKGIKISWSPATDAETPTRFLTYNLHLTDANGKVWLHSETNEDNSFRYRLAPGVAGSKTNFMINNLPHGTYTVTVQALDASFAMSAPTAPVAFTIAPGPTALQIERILLNQVKLSWTNPTAAADNIVVERRLENTDFEMIAALSASATEFIDNDLDYNKKYTYRVYGISGNIPTANSNTVAWNSSLFMAREINIPNVYGSLDAGDFNGDGRMDLIIVGGRITNGSYSELISDLFENKGNGFDRQKIGSPVLNQISNFLFFDFNGDSQLDIYQQGYVYNENRFHTELLKNNGDKTFSSLENLISNNDYQIAGLWDYDMDNDMDLVATRPSNYGTQQILVNESNGLFVVDPSWDINCYNCSINLPVGDFNNDGLEDIWKPNNSGGYVLFINSAFGFINANIEPLYLGGLIFQMVDYNGDGWNDILTYSNEYSPRTTLYKNLGFDKENSKYLGFKSIKNNFYISYATFSAADFDHDGDTDLLFASRISKLYLNEGNDNFKEITIPGIPAVMHNSRLIDIDTDGDLDMYVTGYFSSFTGEEKTNAMIIENQMIVTGKGIPNLAPAMPINLTAEQDEAGMHLSWQATQDDHTPTMSQTFEVIINGSGKTIAKASVNTETGKRMKTEPGGTNASSTIINNLKPGEYTWRVQAVDQSYLGSEFSVPGNFLFRPKVPGIKDTVIYKCGRPVSITATGEQIEWYSDPEATVKIASGPTYQPLASQIVYVTQTVNDIRSIIKKVNITIADRPESPIVTNQNPLLYCENTPVSSNQVLMAQGQNLRWYSDPNKNNLILQQDMYLVVPVVEKNYYVTQTIQNCESNPIEIQVKPSLIDSQLLIENGKLRVKEENGDNYYWYKNNILLSNQNSFILNQDLEPGTYRVSIYKGTCFENSASFVVTATNEEQAVFSFYPNPVSKELIVQLANLNVSKIEVMDITGRIMFTKKIQSTTNAIEIAVDKWSDGVYLLQYYFNNEVRVSKFVVRK